MIDLQASPEQDAIVESVASFLSNRLPRDRLRPEPQPVPNRDRNEWSALGELGVFSLALPGRCGGSGYGLIEELLVFREFGRVLLSPAAISTTMAAHAAAAAHDDEASTTFGSGSIFVAPAISFSATAERGRGLYHLFDAQAGDPILCWDASGLALANPSHLTERRAVAGIDSTVHLERTTLFAAEGNSDATLGLRATLLVSAYLVGVAEAACDQSVEYAKIREQFGQPIGAFQAVKHRCADMLARASAAWNLTLFAGLAQEAAGRDARFQTIAARVMASEAAFRNGAVNIQNHGGIGFTGEHDAHLFVKRAHMLDRFGGDAGVQKKRLLVEPAPFSGSHNRTAN